MSAHEYESIVEQSVEFLDQRPNAPSFDLSNPSMIFSRGTTPASRTFASSVRS